MSLEDKNIIKLRSVYGKVGIRYTISPCKNPRTGRYPDHIKSVNAAGDMILTEKELSDQSLGKKYFIPETWSITIEDGHEFDLTDLISRAEWEAIQYCPIISESLFAKDAHGNLKLDARAKKYSATELFIEKPGEEVKKKVSLRELVHNAHTYIFNDSASNRLKIARLLGKRMENSMDSDVKDYLLSRADKKPEEIISLYTGDDLGVRILILDALDKGVIYIKDKMYCYGDSVFMGTTLDSVTYWFKTPSNSKMVDIIKSDVYGDELTVTNPHALEMLAKKSQKNND